nr:PREDICTED: uncharacterized protein LOC109643279 isoform X1 [Paralichthys olivaceus]
MAGANPLIRAQNTFHSLQSAPYTHSLVHHHQHMHQHTHQHCSFTPILHQHATVPHVPAVQHRNLNTDHTRGTMRPPLAPATAFHSAAQTSCRTKRGRWCALHVCIAWKTYYHKRLQKMQQKLNSLHRESTPESPSAVSPPESQQHEQSERQLSYKHTNTACDQSADRNSGDTCETRITSSPASTTKRDKLERLVHLQWKERRDDNKHGNQQFDTTKDLTLRDESWDLAATPELGSRRGSHGRKRRLLCDSFIKGKRVKQDIVDHRFPYAKIWPNNPSAFSVTHTHLSPCTPVQHANFSGLSVLYPDSSRFNVSSTSGGLAPYPGVAMQHCQSASWEPRWDINNRQAPHSGIPVVPLVLRKQEAAYIRGWDASRKLLPPPPQAAIPSLWLSNTWGAESAGTL